MSDETAPGAALVRHEAQQALGAPLPPMGDAELSTSWRTAKALAESGLFKDVRSAGQAFAKMLAGRDLGLTAFESMSALHVIEGKIEASSDLHATRVRLHPDYDYSIERLDREACALKFVRYSTDETFVSEYSIEDAKASGDFQKTGPGGKPSNYVRYPRNMLFARAMTNGVAWFCPEVMGGLRVYGPGEIDRGEDIAAGVGSGEAPTDDLPTSVEAVIARARDLGHAGLANREAAALAVGGRSPEAGVEWVARATAELNAMERSRARQPSLAMCGAVFGADEDGDPRPAVCERLRGHNGPHVGPMQDPPDAEVVTATPAETPIDPPSAPQDAPEAETGPDHSPPPSESADGAPANAERLREIALQLADDADAAEAEGKEDEAERLRGEASKAMSEADALADPEQGDFGL